jgi:hypothetical protein
MLLGRMANRVQVRSHICSVFYFSSEKKYMRMTFILDTYY